MVTIVLKDACNLMHYLAIIQIRFVKRLLYVVLHSQVVIESDRLDIDKLQHAVS